MRRWIAIAWHASFLALAAALYVLFVLPRWFELTGAWPVGLGQPLRIVDGVLIGLAALPVLFTYLHTRKPEFGTPQLALTLRLSSIVLHVASGVLIVGAAVAELWISLDRAGQWLFGVYGAAAALAVLGALAFYLAYLAELPPPPPKPLKPKKARGRRKGGDDAADADVDDAAEDAPADPPKEIVAEAEPDAEPTVEPADEPADAEDVPPVHTSSIADTDTAEDAADEDAGTLRNRRPAAKGGSRRFLRRRGGVAVDE
jgi:hypothetical protein